MKVGDLVRSRISGWLAIIVATSHDRHRVDFIHLSGEWFGECDYCSKFLFEVVSESR